ncbi:YihY/virulence factor BrkB family protein [Miltoncostaea oceani]|uniref:YihY/virulence factor BrkB family protein n=1 Tax=Miltoncostaea oceani TaxID=2843216 RepID=UPI001C3D7B51|nr:YihY/virulence factor BrkB family protein [Miltoncostaea oceani]
MSTASPVPETSEELEGDEALETIRRTGLLTLARDGFIRFRAADGFSHARALAFQLTLTIIPALIAVVGLAAATERDDVRRFVAETLRSVAPGPMGELLSAAIEQGSVSAAEERGEVALALGGIVALVAGTIAMAQVERGANRIYGLETDRSPVRRYLRATILATTSGALVIAALVVVVAGGALRRVAGFTHVADLVWAIARWPVGIALLIAGTAVLYRHVPNRRQPEASWLAVGAGLSVTVWLTVTAALGAFLGRSGSLGATYGPLAGTIGLLLWALITSLALFVGLSFSAQLEAVRAGVAAPRVETEHDSRAAVHVRTKDLPPS